MLGEDGDDTLFGQVGADRLFGGLGDDLLDGGPDNDDLRALSKADGADVYQGGTGTDTLSYSLRGAAVQVILDGLANDGGSGGLEGDKVGEPAFPGGPEGAAIEIIIGGKGPDLLDGGTLQMRNTFQGGPGNDDVYGGPSNDRLYGSAGNDDLFGDAGKDVLDSRDGVSLNDSISGGTELDVCYADFLDTVLDC